MIWIYLCLITVFLWGLSSTFDKFFLTKWFKNPIINVFIFNVVGFLFSIFIFIFYGTSQVSFPILILAYLDGFLYMLAMYLFFLALKYDDASSVVPLINLTPIFVVILAYIFLSESFLFVTYIGIFLVILGSFFISLKSFSKMSFGPAFYIMLVSDIILASMSIILKYLLNFADPVTIFAHMRVGAFFAFLPFLFIFLKDFKELYFFKGIRGYLLILVVGVVYITGVLLFTIATLFAPVSLVRAVISLHPFMLFLFTLFFSFFLPNILHENYSSKIFFQKLFSILLMIVGVFLILVK